MGKIANKQVICDVLVEAGKKDKDIVALCSDSRGSAFSPCQVVTSRKLLSEKVF